jgi:hypothetical protein
MRGTSFTIPATGRAVAAWPLLLFEDLAISRELLRVENRFDLLVGAIPDAAHFGGLTSRTTAACAIGWRTTPAATATTAPSTAPSTATSTSASASAFTALTARVFSEGLHIHRFVGEDRANSRLLRGIEL